MLAKRDPLQVIVELFAGGDFEHVDLLPIAAGFVAGVGQVAAIVGYVEARQRDRAVFRPLVGVDQHAAFGLVRIGDVQHGLILQAVVLRIEYLPPFSIGGE